MFRSQLRIESSASSDNFFGGAESGEFRLIRYFFATETNAAQSFASSDNFFFGGAPLRVKSSASSGNIFLGSLRLNNSALSEKQLGASQTEEFRIVRQMFFLVR